MGVFVVRSPLNGIFSHVIAFGLSLTLLVSCLMAESREPIIVKSTSLQKGVVLVEADVANKAVELECALTSLPCKALPAGNYAMVRLAPSDSIYHDCTNVAVYSSLPESDTAKLGTYCLLQDGSDRCYGSDCVSAKVPTITSGSATTKAQPANVEITTDTLGVDFHPYLDKITAAVRAQWFPLVPAKAKPPEFKQGTVVIAFAILPDGRVAGMKLEGRSGDKDLDRAAWGGISGCVPFPPLPAKFTGPYLGLRFRFYYNPPKQQDARK